MATRDPPASPSADPWSAETQLVPQGPLDAVHDVQLWRAPPPWRAAAERCNRWQRPIRQ